MKHHYSDQNELFSDVEKSFIAQSGLKSYTTRMPYVVVDNFPQLGMLTALRFLEWVAQNPEGVISLPTGKTPEFFIRYTQFLLENWNHEAGRKILVPHGLGDIKKPQTHDLKFVQIDEFYPIDPLQHNSFHNYVTKFYINGFGLDPSRALLINSDAIALTDNKCYREVFPDLSIDLSLRYREARSSLEQLQQQSILSIDNWCTAYEQQIRDMGGIGFFLGGIGPDGHIAFNTRGSDHFSTTRLTSTNFETQAVSAGDLGGIEVSRNRLVITVGLQTITYNPDAVAIIFAAGESKAEIIKQSLESDPSNQYPASVLHYLKGARFYLTQGATVRLTDTVDRYYSQGQWDHRKTERAVIDLCTKIDKYGHHLTLEDLKADPYCRLIPSLDENTVQSVIDSITQKLQLGMVKDENQVFYHTGPHHDDIMLGIMPHTNRQVRSASNDLHFSVMTSGFTAVTNQFVSAYLAETRTLLANDQIQMIHFPDFFEDGYKHKWAKDMHHYLDNVAANNQAERTRGVCHRLVRAVVTIWEVKSATMLTDTIHSILAQLADSYDGGINPPKIQKLKGMIREFEEELVWAHFGVRFENIHHLRLGFYKGDIFTEQPDRTRDVQPILEEFRKYKPTVISLVMDPEGSGPDTHYKVLQAIASAVKAWSLEADLSNLKIIGYRNVWFKYHPAEADVIAPVSLNALAILDKSFADCYLSQVNASFPSHELDGKFSALAQRRWVEQLKQIQLLLGKNYFYQNEHPLLRATHGLLYMKELSVGQFLDIARELEEAMEGIVQIKK